MKGKILDYFDERFYRGVTQLELRTKFGDIVVPTLDELVKEEHLIVDDSHGHPIYRRNYKI